MKTFPLVLLSVTLALSTRYGCAQSAKTSPMPESTLGAQNAQNIHDAHDTLSDAQRAYLRGDMDTAKQLFKIELELDPHNVTAINYMRMINTQEKSNGETSALREKQLAALILPHVELNEATLGTALDYLKQSAARQGVTDVSFVVQAPQDVVDSKKVTLNLSKIPFTEVMRYMGELTGFKFAIEKYAIVVKPDAVTVVTSASPVPAPAATP